MINRILTLFCIIIAFPMAAETASAMPISQLSNYLNQELRQIGTALDNADEQNATDNGAWSVKNFYLRLQATVGFSLPNFLSVDLVPQVELVFHRRDKATKN